MLKSSRQYIPTYILIAVNIAIYVYTSLLSGNIVATSDQVIDSFGQYNALVFDGEVWRIFTGMFVHANIGHIAGNMLFLLIFGLRAEDLFDLKEYLGIYFLSGLAGGLLSLLLGPNLVSVGASGAIFGMLGAATVYVKRAIGQSIMTALLYAFLLFIVNVGPSVNLMAHLGGLTVGLVIGYSLASMRRIKVTTGHEYIYSYST